MNCSIQTPRDYLVLGLACLLLGSGLAAGMALIPPSTSDAVLKGPLVRAIDRAQREFESDLKIYVDHSTPENPWRVTGSYYSVEGVRSFRQVDSLARGLDQMLPKFQGILGSDWTPDRPLSVIVVPDLARFNEAGDEWGDARSSYMSAFLAVDHPERAVVSLGGVNDTQTLIWATNAAAQQFVDRAFTQRLDPWLEQGIGAYFSLYWDWDWGSAQLKIAIDEDSYIPMANLIGADIGGYADRANVRVIELGMLFSYLLHTREETRIIQDGEQTETSFQSYLQDSLRGRNTSRHPFRLWFTENADSIERDFRATYGS